MLFTIFFIAVYLPPQTNSGTKTTFNKLYRAISKQENANSEAGFLVASEFYAGKLKSVLNQFLPACHLCNKTLDHLHFVSRNV
jgi:hypothetical protein